MREVDRDLKTETMRREGSGVTTKFKRILSNRSLFSLWVAQTISQIGDYGFNVALLWYVLESTGSIFLVALTQAVVATPVAVIGPLAGVYVDRFNRKTMMIVSSLFQGAVVAIFALFFFSGKLTFEEIITLVFLLFSGQQFFVGALNAYVPKAVDPDDLAAANALFSLSNVSNQFLGYVFGGIIVSLFGVSLIIGYDCISFFIGAALLLGCSSAYGMIAGTSSVSESLQKPFLKYSSNFISDFKKGVSYIRNSSVMLEIMVVGIVLTFFADGLVALLPAYAQYQLNGNSVIYGLVLAAAVIGGIIGSVIFGSVESRHYLGKIFVLCTALSGLATLALGLTSSAVIAFLVAIVMGGSYFVANVCVQVFVQGTVPGPLLGRVYTVLFGILNIFAPIGAIMSGVFSGYISPGQIFALYGVGVFCVGVLMVLAFGKLRNAKY